MPVQLRSYRHPEDYEDVGAFLVRTYAATAAGPHRNWLQPRWEYMHYHPDSYGRESELERCGLWTNDGRIVAVVHFEDRMGIIYVQLDPTYASLKRDLLAYAIEHLSGDFNAGPAVHVYLDEEDAEFGGVAETLGFSKMGAEQSEVTSRLTASDLPAEIPAPDGFEILGLDEDDDVAKVHRVMHRGFNHDGEPPEDELDDRRRKLLAPGLRKDLTVVARAPDGRFVSFCGMWIDAANRVAYVEPVATDPDYRRMGLGTAVVLEGVRRCVAEGATVAYVGSNQPFYLSMGFEVCATHALWRKVLPGAAGVD